MALNRVRAGFSPALPAHLAITGVRHKLGLKSREPRIIVPTKIVPIDKSEITGRLIKDPEAVNLEN